MTAASYRETGDVHGAEGGQGRIAQSAQCDCQPVFVRNVEVKLQRQLVVVVLESSGGHDLRSWRSGDQAVADVLGSDTVDTARRYYSLRRQRRIGLEERMGLEVGDDPWVR